MKLSHRYRWFSRSYRPEKAVENRSRSRGIVAGQSSRDLPGIGEESVSLVELFLGDELPALVDRLRVLLDGDSNDAG